MKLSSDKLTDFYKNFEEPINISALIILCIIAFYNTLSSYFIIIDDFNSLVHTTRSIISVFVTNSYGGNAGGNYRPLEALSHMIDTYLYGSFNTFGRHITNLILHVFNTIFVYKIASYITKKKTIGLIAGLLFSISLTNSYAISPVSQISGRPELLVTFFSLLTIILFIKSISKSSLFIYLFSLITFILALMSKEMAVTLPIISLIYIVIFHYSKPECKIIDFKYANSVVIILLLALISIVPIGIIASPAIIAKYLSRDGVLQQASIDRIEFIRHVLISGGGIIAILSGLLFLIVKFSKKAKDLFQLVKYSIPYFLILIAFLILREIILGGFGGVYNSSEGNVIFQHGLDSFMRDVFSLAGFIWPVGIDYNIFVFNLQVEHNFIFYTVSILITLVLIIILYRLIISKRKTLLFSYLWIFIVLMPAHNIIIPSWQFQAKYLYLPAVGFCLFISILIYKLVQYKNWNFNFNKIGIPLILLIIIVNTILIVNHNEKLSQDGEINKGFVLDMKKYEKKISDLTNLYFIVFPNSPLNTVSNVYITAYMDDLLDFTNNSNGYALKQYNYSLLLFKKNNKESNISIDWLSKREFIIKGIDPTNYFFIPNNPSFLDRRMEEIYKTAPHYITQLLSSGNQIKETKDAVFKVVNWNENSKKADVEVKLKAKIDNEGKEDLFFIYKDSHFQLINDLKKDDLEEEILHY